MAFVVAEVYEKDVAVEEVAAADFWGGHDCGVEIVVIDDYMTYLRVQRSRRLIESQGGFVADVQTGVLTVTTGVKIGQPFRGSNYNDRNALPARPMTSAERLEREVRVESARSKRLW
jgi:hypothetical protein